MRVRLVVTMLAAALVALAISAPATVLSHEGPDLDPRLVAATLKVGTSLDVTKTVHTPAIPPRPHICFLADNTGSMGPAIDNVKANASDVIALVNAIHPDTQYCVARYRDFTDPSAFDLIQPLTTDKALVLSGIDAWFADGGGDTQEAQLNGLAELAAHMKANPKTDATPIIVWFGDASGHDPSGGHTAASVQAQLAASGIRVVAINVVSGFGDGLDAKGQASKITAATSGVFLSDVPPDAVADAIVTGLTNLPVEVGMASNCSSPINVSFDPPSQTVTSGTDAVFTETIAVKPDAKPGTYECDDWATLDGVAMTDDAGNVILEHKIITVPNPEVAKDPQLANLWLCNTGAPTCDNKESGVEEVNLNVDLTQPVTSNAKGERQSIGSFEFEVRFDAKLLTVNVVRGPLLTHPDVSCTSTRGEGFVQWRCVTKGKARVEFGPGTLAQVRARATPDVYSMLIANQQNGIATQLINQGCNLSDLQGHPIKLGNPGPTDPCGDAAVTIRYLEGDVHADCVVDVRDQQQISFRWGARQGNLLYNSRFDLEPSAPKKGDGDIDAKDLQAVYGRHGSTCKAPHPPQDPVDPKAKVGPPPPSDVSE